MKEPHSEVMHADSFFTTTALQQQDSAATPPSHGAGAARRDDTLQLAHGMVSARRRYQHQPPVIRCAISRVVLAAPPPVLSLPATLACWLERERERALLSMPTPLHSRPCLDGNSRRIVAERVPSHRSTRHASCRPACLQVRHVMMSSRTLAPFQ
jgi:hypothetical protein